MTPEDMRKREQELNELRASIEKFQGDADTSIQKKSADLLQPDILVPAGLLALSFLLPGIVKRIRKNRPAKEPPADRRECPR
jgi:hypothetical protein